MMDKRQQTNIRVTNEEWEIIQMAAKKRHQASGGFIISIAQNEAGGE